MTESRTMIRMEARGEERKRLVKAIAEYRETFSEYAGAPSFAYRVSDITIDRDGAMIFDAEPDPKELEDLLACLAGKGFTEGGAGPAVKENETAAVLDDEPDVDCMSETDIGMPEDDNDTIEDENGGMAHETEALIENADDGSDKLVIELPREGFSDTALANLQKLIDSKASLLKKSLGTDELSVEITEDRIRFPWFHTDNAMDVAAYARLVSAIGRMAKEAKRVTGTDHPVESEKYAFRIWLLRLGFTGAKFKNDRAVLMKNLSGHAAFKNLSDADAFYRKLREKKEALKAGVDAVAIPDDGEEAQEA